MVVISGALIDTRASLACHLAVRHELLEAIGVPADSVARKGEALALSEAKYKYVGALRVSHVSHIFPKIVAGMVVRQYDSMVVGNMAMWQYGCMGMWQCGNVWQYRIFNYMRNCVLRNVMIMQSCIYSSL